MSTIIRHGFRLKAGIDPFDFIARVREHMDPARDIADAKLLAELYAEQIDRDWFAGKPIEAEAGYTIWRTWHLEQSKMRPMERRHDPNEFGIQLAKDSLTGDYYVLVVTYNHDLREAFEEMQEVTEYGYWNDSNGPEDLSDKEWEHRKQLWNRIIPRAGRSNMVTFTLRNAYDGGVRELVDGEGDADSPIYGQLPTDRERAKSVAMDAYTTYLAREVGIDVMDACNHVIFGRSTNINLVIDVATAYLPAITPDLVTKGSEGAAIDSGYKEAMRAACEHLAELDKKKLAR
jgi:hypothetical protein